MFHIVAHASQEQQCLWAERAHTLWTVVMGGKCQRICPCPLPIFPSGVILPPPLLFFFFFAFPWGFLVAAGAVQMKSVYCSSELTVCIFLILPYLYLLFVSRTSHIIILEAMGKLVVTLFCCVVFLSTAGKKSNCSGSSVSL